MKKIVFYSWQSDLSNGTNRTLIENALRDAAKEIGNDPDADIEPVIDRDTQGVAGAPNIATAIFQKIDLADIFVADVSIIGNVKKRAVPNPNVLIELGYALKILGHERIILVFNTAFGKIEKLPFDLRMHRTIAYQCAESILDRSEIKKNLVKDFKSALLTGFSYITSKKTSMPIIDVIKNNMPSKKIELRTHLANILSDLEKLQPPMKRDGGTIEELLIAISKTKNISIEFSELAETIVLMNDLDSAKEVFQWFGKILTKYDPIIESDGQIWNCDGDFYKFIGHEFFVDFITPFLQEEKWEELKEILKGNIRVGPTNHHKDEIKESWTQLSESVLLLSDEGRKRNVLSLHGNILKERHENRILPKLSPFKYFLETDLFLSLYGEGEIKNRYSFGWFPRSILWLEHTPSFISEAINYPTAMKICKSLSIDQVEELKNRLIISRRFESVRIYPITNQDIEKIGSEGGAKIFYPSD